MSTFRDLLRRAREAIREVAPAEAQALRGSAIFLDVREADEWAQGHLEGAMHIPRGHLEQRVEGLVPDRAAEVVVYCGGGSRSAFAARTLGEMGYTRVASLAGGFGRWKETGLPFVVPRTFTAAQRQRYSRHLLLPEVGESGQGRLLEAKVLLVGVGGLGCPAAMYLAAAGVGTLGLVDSDVVDLSNLQRQVLHASASVGQPKTASAAATLTAQNPDVRVERHDLRLTADNVMDVLAPYDVVVDGADNFPTRYLVNDAAVLLGKPVAYGSIFRFEGQASTFLPRRGPCYRCLFPEPPPAEQAPSCDEAGVLGVLPGLIGVVQATEVIKVLLGRGETLSGRLLSYDALALGFREFQFGRDPACAVCGDAPSITAPADLAWSCRFEAARR